MIELFPESGEFQIGEKRMKLTDEVPAEYVLCNGERMPSMGEYDFKRGYIEFDPPTYSCEVERFEVCGVPVDLNHDRYFMPWCFPRVHIKWHVEAR